MRNIWIEIRNFEKEMDRWGRTEEVYWQGAEIIERFLPYSRLKTLMLRVKKPNSKHWNHLLYQIKKLKPSHSSNAHIKKKPEVKPVMEPEKAMASVKLTVNLANDKIEEITSRIRQMATERALLSNQLTDPGDDPVLIQKNCEILDRIDPLMEKMKELEKELGDVKAGKIAAPEEDADRIVLTRANESYTMKELYAMSMTEIQALKTRLIKDIYKLEQRSLNNKTEKYRKVAQEGKKKAELMKLLLDKILLERKSIID